MFNPTRLEIYRLKLPEGMNADSVVSGYPDDPRIKWLEPNLELTIPDPVPQETRKKIEEK